MPQNEQTVKAAEWVPIGDLTPWDRNPRRNDHAVDEVARSIERFGWGAVIIARKADNVVIAGHTRLKAAQKLGMDKVPVRWLDLDPAEAAALALADNKVGELADWDNGALSEVLRALESDGVDLDGLGFSAEELEGLIGVETLPGSEGEDDVPEVPDKPNSVLGGVYELGPHRLVCGDSTTVEAWDALDARDGSVFTSPPYNLTSSALSGNRALSVRGSAYLDSESPWLPLMNGWMAEAAARCSVVVCNVQVLAGNKRDLFGWVSDWSSRLVDVAVWDKGTAPPQMAANVLGCAWEFLFIFGEEGASRAVPTGDFHGTVHNIHRAPPQQSNEFARVHGATFPIHLPKWAIDTVLARARTVVDPFGGTGTTMIAAAQKGRVARLIELDPRYCDVIRRRWTRYALKHGLDVGPGGLE